MIDGRRLRWAMGALAAVYALSIAPGAAAATGELSQAPGALGCATANGSDGEGGACLDATLMSGPPDAAVSPDGRNVYVLTSNSNSIEILDRDPTTGALAVKPPPAGCVHLSGAAGCQDARALQSPARIALSPDGRHVYVASSLSDALAIFDRDPNTGVLTQKPGAAGCINKDGALEDGVACANGVALEDVDSVAVSPDGKTVYSAARGDAGFGQGLATFDRNPTTGALTQKTGDDGCVTHDGDGDADGDGLCADGRALSEANDVTISPDGESVYATAIVTSDSLTVFDRDPNGLLTQKAGLAGCVSETGASEDGAGTCQDGTGLDNPASVIVSSDGRNVYVGSLLSSAIAVFDRHSDGEVGQKNGTDACINESGGPCTAGRAIEGRELALSPDDAHLYATDQGSDAVAALVRAPATGRLSQPSGTAGCISDDGSSPDGPATCADGRALNGATGLAVSPDGRGVYVTSFSAAALAALERDLPPSCASSQFTVLHGIARQIPLSCSDPNGDAMALTIATGPSNGTLGAIDPASARVTYTPEPGFSGADAFSYRATANGNDSATALIGLDVLPPGASGPQGPAGPAGSQGPAGPAGETSQNLVVVLAAPERAVAGRKITVRATCAEACTLAAEGEAVAKGSKRKGSARRRAKGTTKVALRPVEKEAAGGETVALDLQASPKQRRKLRKAVRRAKRAVANLSVTVADEAGNEAATELRVKLQT